MWWEPQNHWRPWGVEECQRQLWPGNICQLDYEIYFWFSVLFFLFSLQILLSGLLGPANAESYELQTQTVLGCLSLKLRGLMQQWAAISYIRKPIFLQTALTSHNSYGTSKAQFCSCLHPFSFNSYCWFIWGTRSEIWDSFPILKKKKTTLWIQLSCRLKFWSAYFPFNATDLSFCLLPIFRKLLKFKLCEYTSYKTITKTVLVQ